VRPARKEGRNGALTKRGGEGVSHEELPLTATLDFDVVINWLWGERGDPGGMRDLKMVSVEFSDELCLVGGGEDPRVLKDCDRWRWRAS